MFYSLNKLIASLSLFALNLSCVQASDTGMEACPMFHCNPEATGIVLSETVDVPHAIHWNPTREGVLTAQGCSGNAKLLACIYSVDSTKTGNFKVYDPATHSLKFGSGLGHSYNPTPYASFGQVPYIENGYFLLADDLQITKYDSAGSVVAKLPLLSTKDSVAFGIVPLEYNVGMSDHMNGMLTLFERDTLKRLHAVQLTSLAGTPLTLVSPSTGSGNRIYSVGISDKGLGHLVATEVVDNKLVNRWIYPYIGITGASPVILSPKTSGKLYPIILLHTPRPSRIIAIEDRGNMAKVLWTFDLSGIIRVSPLADVANQRIYVQEQDGVVIKVLNLEGKLIDQVNVGSLVESVTGSTSIGLNGHVGGTFAEGQLRLLLSISSPNGQFVASIDPILHKRIWVKKINPEAEKYTAAWTVTIDPKEGACPIVVGPKSGITELCPSKLID